MHRSIMISGLVMVLCAMIPMVGATACPYAGSEDHFRCRDGGICIPSHFKCDGIEQCGDGSDESDETCNSCPEVFCLQNCELGFLQDANGCYTCECQEACPIDNMCADGTCMDNVVVKCDNIEQCVDGSDESDGTCRLVGDRYNIQNRDTCNSISEAQCSAYATANDYNFHPLTFITSSVDRPPGCYISVSTSRQTEMLYIPLTSTGRCTHIRQCVCTENEPKTRTTAAPISRKPITTAALINRKPKTTAAPITREKCCCGNECDGRRKCADCFPKKAMADAKMKEAFISFASRRRDA